MNIKENINFIIGKQLIQIKANLYSIDLVFEDNVIISIANKVTYIDKETNKEQQWDWINNQEFSINKLLETSVVKANLDLKDNLTIEMENNKLLIIESSIDEGESYTIYKDDDIQVM